LQIPDNSEIDVVVVGPGFGECILIHIGDGDWIIVDSCLDNSSGRPAALFFLNISELTQGRRLNSSVRPIGMMIMSVGSRTCFKLAEAPTSLDRQLSVAVSSSS